MNALEEQNPHHNMVELENVWQTFSNKISLIIIEIITILTT